MKRPCIKRLMGSIYLALFGINILYMYKPKTIPHEKNSSFCFYSDSFI